MCFDLMCSVRSSLLEVTALQMLQFKSSFSLCIFKWLLNLFQGNSLSHVGQVKDISSPCLFTCFSYSCLSLNLSEHIWHLRSRCLWRLSICLFRSFSLSQIFSHFWHMFESLACLCSWWTFQYPILNCNWFCFLSCLLDCVLACSLSHPEWSYLPFRLRITL